MIDWTKPLEFKQGYGRSAVNASYVGKTPTGDVVVCYAQGCYATVNPETGLGVFGLDWKVTNKLPAWEQAYAAEPDWGSNKEFYKAGWDAAMREWKQ